ncbi:Unknown protein sequence [Pseudomonas syringae pv. cerasicola]|uniref:Uncharacterized protein n=1 Tax=Pseudomonas syringae pv. cerasicola TaxID=264451 RepID=A0A0P9M9D2_PSESX|nr:Unknown protein sequence [Pseudomonas syringae pv. cerasicola]
MQTPLDVLGDDNAIVHQQAKGQDDRGNRHRLQFYPQRAHDQQCTQDGQGHNHPDHQAGTPAKKQHDHTHHDNDRFGHDVIHLVHFVLNHAGLKRYDVQGKTRWKLLFQLTELFAQSGTERLDIEPWLHRNGQHHSILPLIDRFGFRRVDRAHRYSGQVMQRYHLSARQLHGKLTKLIQRQHLAADRERGALLPDDRVASRRDQVAVLQLLEQLLRRKSGCRQGLVIEVEVDSLVLQAIQLDLIDTLELIKLIAQAFYRRAHLAHGKTRRRQRNGSHCHATEIIVHKGPLGTSRENAVRFADLRPESLPQQPQILDGVIRRDLHNHPAWLERGDNVLDLGQFTDAFFEWPGKQLFRPLGGESWQGYADQCVANRNRRLFLRRKPQKGRDTGQQNQEGRKQGQAARAHCAVGKTHCVPPFKRVLG